MGRSIRLAAVQMDAAPAPLTARLAQAEPLIAAAASDGAQLVALPELFNLGYAYQQENFARAETFDGPTIAWMRAQAARHGIHLAGSLLLRQADDIYNTLALVAPDGELWHYNKRFPWGWERAYFRPGSGYTIADTALGKIGLLVCWDVGHPSLWREYAGKVQLMLACSCPPNASNPRYRFANGAELTLASLPGMRQIDNSAQLAFLDGVADQTAWLGVPSLNTTACGTVNTPIPRARRLLLSLGALAPALLRHLPYADTMQMSCGLVAAGRILAADGSALAASAQESGPSFIAADVEVPDAPPQPQGQQPRSRLPGMAYALSDKMLPQMVEPVYRAGVGQRRGGGAKPLIAVAALLGWLALRRARSAR